MKPRFMCKIINRKRYSTETATLIAGNDHWDGHNFERAGTQTFLYRTPKGFYFATYLTCWEGDRDTIEALSLDEAIELYENLTEHRVKFEEAFPSVTIEET